MNEEYKDIQLTCLCGEPFVWEAGEQKFLNDLASDGKIPSVQVPKRCVDCRRKKRELRDANKNQTEY